MKLVKFENGEYGIRTYWLFGWRFLWLSGGFTEWRGSHRFHLCRGKKEDALKIIADRNMKYEVTNETR